jgi:hypothetical protein
MAMGESVRFVLRQVMGRIRCIHRAPNIQVSSVVHITAAEVRPRPSRDTSHPPQDYEFITIRLPGSGDADVWVTNISPDLGNVQYFLHVAWSAPLDIAVTITVENDFIEIQEFDRYR